jgi:ComF family protein
MIHIWHQLLDLLFPPSEALRDLRTATEKDFLFAITPITRQGVITLTSYQTPLIKHAITAGKFEHNFSALQALGKILAHYLSQANYDPVTTILVPIPLHHKRQQERGYNQVVEIIKYANQRVSLPYQILPLLMRTKATKMQSHLAKSARLDNIKDAFVYNSGPIDWSRVAHVILIDDVITTGATLASAATVLRGNLPPSVTLVCLAIARA